MRVTAPDNPRDGDEHCPPGQASGSKPLPGPLLGDCTAHYEGTRAGPSGRSRRGSLRDVVISQKVDQGSF